MDPDAADLEARLLRQPTLELWAEVRARYKSAPATRRGPAVLGLYGLACVQCHAPGTAHFDKGRLLLEQAAELHEEDGSIAAAASSRLHLAEAEQRAGHDRRGRELIEQALRCARNVGDRGTEARALQALGLACLSGGEPRGAEAALDELEPLVRRGSSAERWRWHHLRARILEQAGDARLAALELTRAWDALAPPGPPDAARTLGADALCLKQSLEPST
jgi:hypothetical protein